jgi:hypothetical protein
MNPSTGKEKTKVVHGLQMVASTLQFAAKTHLLKLQRLQTGFFAPLASFLGVHEFAICM